MNPVLISTYKKANKFMLIVIWLMCIISLLLSNWYDTWHLALTVGLPTAIIPTVLIYFIPYHFITRATVAISLMAFSALHIQQAAGMTEFHFGIFVLLAVLLCYSDWKVIFIAALTIAIHHLSFSYFQELAWGIVCFSQPGLKMVLLHATYVVIESILLIYLAIQSYTNTVEGAELSLIVEKITNEKNVINLKLEKNQNVTGLSEDFYNIVEHLQKTLTQLNSQVQSMAQCATQITEGNSQAVQYSSLQSDSIQNTTNSITVLTATINNNIGNINNANNLIKKTVENANQGGEVVSEVVNTMNTIKESSKKIVDIIAVIDSIAFQTNILALNAAVEAARAGEQGRGFAVVASEVRNLAQNSAKAAKEIKELINDSVKSIDSGHSLVSKAGESITSIIQSIYCIKEVVEKISIEGASQQNEVKNANCSLAEVQTISQKNNELVMYAEQLAKNIEHQAKELETEIKIFKL